MGATRPLVGADWFPDRRGTLRVGPETDPPWASRPRPAASSFLVFARWHDWHRDWTFDRTSGPPAARGMTWSTWFAADPHRRQVPPSRIRARDRSRFQDLVA